jgi:hypothetical protein
MGNPQFQQRMQQKANEPSIGGAIGKIGCGGFMALVFGISLMVYGFHGYAVSALVGLFLGLSVAGLISGGAGLGKKKLPLAAFLGVAAVVALVSTFAGPPMGTAYGKGNEEDKYEELVSAMKEDSFNPERWKTDYFTFIDSEFRRPEWEGQYMIARVKRAKLDDKPGDLRAIMAEIDDKDDVDDDVEKLFEKARDDASDAFNEYYEKAQKVLYADVSGNREFPVDPALRKSFSTILDDLATSSDGNVHVAFVNATQLAKPKGSDKVLQQMRATQPGGKNGKVIEQGEAFSPAYDQARRDTFMQAMDESFKQVFASEGLLTLVPLAKGDDRDGKIIFEVSSEIIRIPDYYIYTQNNIFAGFLFAIEVEWGFKIYDREGKVLYAPEPRKSLPAENVRVSRQPGDPTWAMYSVMMDSAYFNYAREMTGRFGLKPPPEKTHFSYKRPKKGKSLR